MGRHSSFHSNLALQPNHDHHHDHHDLCLFSCLATTCFLINMDYTMEDSQNSAPDAHETSKLASPAPNNDTQSVTKR